MTKSTSFLRPKYLLDARAQLKAARWMPQDAAGLRAVEDKAVAQVVKFQEDLGLQVVGDGEFRRIFFHVDFLVQLQGLTEKGGLSIKFHRAEGDIDYSPPVLEISGKVRHNKAIQGADFDYLKSVTHVVPKVTIPSPTMLHFRARREGINKEAYPDIEGFYADVATAFQQEIADLAAAGLRYLQPDDTNLAYLCDPQQRAQARGHDPDDLPRAYARLINAAQAGRPKDMLTGIHLCRGNFRSSWAAEGGYEPVSEAPFNALDVDAYFLEYDDARSGDFKPLRHVPKGKISVLGLVTTKLGELESKDAIKRRIDEAAQYCPVK